MTANVERDRAVNRRLAQEGWTVVRIWDFELARDLGGAVERLRGALENRARLASDQNPGRTP
jgi:G:T-mismatch repair DNA endonuclease (very short patch repair protein)